MKNKRNDFKGLIHLKSILIYATLIVFIIPNQGSSQDLFDPYKKYESKKYSYSIEIPKSFQQTSASQANTDLKFIDSFKAQIIINVTDRQPEEYDITAHDYSKDLLENSFRQFSPNLEIISDKKIYIDGQDAFMIEYIGGIKSVKVMETHLFYRDKAFVITAMMYAKKFDRYRELFTKATKSIRF